VSMYVERELTIFRAQNACAFPHSAAAELWEAGEPGSGQRSGWVVHVQCRLPAGPERLAVPTRHGGWGSRTAWPVCLLLAVGTVDGFSGLSDQGRGSVLL